MTTDQTSDQRTDGPTAADQAQDRRRPGRLPRVSPALVGLLRGETDTGAPRPDERQLGHDLDTARGILLAAAVGLGFWVFLFWVIRALLR